MTLDSIAICMCITFNLRCANDNRLSTLSPGRTMYGGSGYKLNIVPSVVDVENEWCGLPVESTKTQNGLWNEWKRYVNERNLLDSQSNRGRTMLFVWREREKSIRIKTSIIVRASNTIKSTSPHNHHQQRPHQCIKWYIVCSNLVWAMCQLCLCATSFCCCF